MSNYLTVSSEILNECEKLYQKDQKFTDEIFMLLHSVFGDVLVRALELMENGKLIIYQTKDGVRKILKVKGKSEDCYMLFDNINYCPCPAFKFQVLHQNLFMTCKHVLAARLMKITGKVIVESYTNEQIRDILNNQIPVDSE